MMMMAQLSSRGHLALTAFLLYTLVVMCVSGQEMEKENTLQATSNTNNEAFANTIVNDDDSNDNVHGDDTCSERIRQEVQKSVWDTFTSQMDTIHASLEESNQRVQEAESTKLETERSLTAQVDQLTQELDQMKANMQESDIQENFMSNLILKWKTRYEDAHNGQLAAQEERNKLQVSVQHLQERLVLVETENAQREQGTVELIDASRKELKDQLSSRLGHLQARNDKLTASEKQHSDDIHRYADQLQATKSRLFDVRQELFHSNRNLRRLENKESAFRDFFLSWYESGEWIFLEVNERAEPVYDWAASVGGGLYQSLQHFAYETVAETHALRSNMHGWYKSSVKPHVGPLIASTKEVVGPLWARIQTSPATAKLVQVGAPIAAYSLVKKDQLFQWVRFIQDTLAQMLRISSQALHSYLALEGAPAVLVSATLYIHSNAQTTVVYIQAVLAILAVVLLFKPASRATALVDAPLSTKTNGVTHSSKTNGTTSSSETSDVSSNTDTLEDESPTKQVRWAQAQAF